MPIFSIFLETYLKDKKQKSNHKSEVKQGRVLLNTNEDTADSSLQSWQALVRKLFGSWKQNFPLQTSANMLAQDNKREKL
jgi:FtsZ-binding cell division protein ZapB